ncbi:MAG: PEP-CTERM sorting domain-containing protein [Chloroflexota bacterium]
MMRCLRRLLFLPLFILQVALFGSAFTSASAQVQNNEWIAFSSSYSIIDGELLSRGTIVSAHDPSGRLCGYYQVRVSGRYGPLRCYFDDPTTPLTDEGIDPGDMVTFRIGGVTVGSFLVQDATQDREPDDPPIDIPEPITVFLFGGGLAGTGAVAWWRKRLHRQ